MKEFTVALNTGLGYTLEYILAPDAEHAAWVALELATERDARLVDVRPTTVNFDW